MAGEVIREVVIKARIETDGSAMKGVNAETAKAKENAKGLTEEAKKHKRAIEEAKQAASLAAVQQKAEIQQQAAARKAAHQQAAADQKAALQAETAARKAAAAEETALLKEAARQRKIIADEEKRQFDEMRRRKNADLADEKKAQGNRGAFGLEGAPKGFGGVATVTIAATTAFLSAPRVLGAAAEEVKGIRADIAGGSTAQGGGLFTQAGNAFEEALGLKSGEIGKSIIEGFTGRSIPGLSGASSPFIATEPPKPGGPSPEEILAKEIAALQQKKQLQDELTRIERDAMKSQLEAAKEARSLAEQQLKTITESINRAKEEFGLMNRRDQQTAIDIAEKIKSGGVGSLTEQELEFANKNSAFKGVLADEARANADTAGFDRIAAALGLDRKQQEAEAEVRAKVTFENDINVRIMDAEKIGEQIAAELAPKLEEQTRRMLAFIEDEIKKNEQRRKMGGGNRVVPNF